jgi:hypothetical protein
MADTLTMDIATTVATKVAGAMTEQAQQVVAAVVRKIRDKLRKDRDKVATLDAASAGDTAASVPLARILDGEFALDPGFRDEIRALWLQVAPAAQGDAVSNVFTGNADKVTQLRDVHGNLTIN